MPWSIDDKQQLVKVCALGDAHNVVRWETADEINMVVWTPDPEPHTVIGDSWAGKVADIQRMKTEIWRGVLDSLAEALVPRTEVVEGQVNIDDALSNEIGALVRVRQPGMVRPISTPFVGQQALPLLEIADKMKEDRVGAMAASDGLSAEAMQSSTKMAVAATIGGSKAHKELLARGFANNFLKPIFRGLLRLFVENQDKPKTMRLRGKWVPVDPRGWNADMDADVNVALALATNEEKMGFLGLVVQKQEQILQTLGPSNPLVGLDQYAATLRRMVEMAGYRNADQFFKPVDPNWAPPQPQQQQPDPAQQLVAAQTRSIEAELVLKKQKQDADLAAERDRLLMDDDYRRDKMSQDAILALQEMELKYGVQLDTTRAKIAAEQAVKRDQLATNALQQTQPAAAPQMQPPTA
jgi:hypothetical protein